MVLAYPSGNWAKDRMTSWTFLGVAKGMLQCLEACAPGLRICLHLHSIHIWYWMLPCGVPLTVDQAFVPGRALLSQCLYSPDAAVAGRLARCIIPSLWRGGVRGLDAMLVCSTKFQGLAHKALLSVCTTVAHSGAMHGLVTFTKQHPHDCNEGVCTVRMSAKNWPLKSPC